MNTRVIRAVINMKLDKEDTVELDYMFEDDPDAAVYRRIIWAIAGLYLWIPLLIIGARLVSLS